MTADRPRVLVTGAAGRLGSTVARLFHTAGYSLLTTDVVDAGTVTYPFVQADLRDHVAASSLLADIDVVLHIGNHPGIGSTPPQVVFNENVTMNENVFQGAAERGASTIVFASTLQLIGSHPDERTVVTEAARPRYPLDERAAPDPSNVYALSKTVSETMLRYYAERCGLACTALRLPLLHRHETRFVVASGHERPVDVFEAFTGLSYDDAARLFLAVVRAGLPGYRVYLAGTSHRHRDLPVAELVERFYPDVPRGVRDLVDISTITDEVGWRPTDAYRPTASHHDPSKHPDRPQEHQP
jgi:nucleoside-diphosphate-sugar epimerase